MSKGLAQATRSLPSAMVSGIMRWRLANGREISRLDEVGVEREGVDAHVLELGVGRRCARAISGSPTVPPGSRRFGKRKLDTRS